MSTRYVSAMAVSHAALDAIMIPSSKSVKPSAFNLEPNMFADRLRTVSAENKSPAYTITALGHSSGDQEVSS